MANRPKISLDTDKEYNPCFGRGQDNQIGLKLSFQWDVKTAKVEFTPTELYQGWPGVVHGGIITCILDKAMGHATLFEGMNCVTAEIRIKLGRPALIGEPLAITSSVIKKTRKLVETSASMSLKDGTRIAEGTSKHFVIEARSIEKSDE